MCLPWNDSPRNNRNAHSTVQNVPQAPKFTPAPATPAPASTASDKGNLTYVGYGDRKARQLDRVYSVLTDQRAPTTLAMISRLTGLRNEGSIASRIREIRELGFEIERTTHPATGKGARVYQYQMV